MNRYLNISLAYVAAGLCAGVFYREFTKFNGYTGVTTLGRIHPHLIVLGAAVFLLVALFSCLGDLRSSRAFRLFLPIYNAGLIVTVALMLARGIPQVLGMELSRAVDASISGIAGIGHILLGTGLVLLVQGLKTLSAAKSPSKA